MICCRRNRRRWSSICSARSQSGSGYDPGVSLIQDASARRRGGKALRTTEISADAFIRPRLGETPIEELTAKIIRGGHLQLAEAAPRLRTRKGAVRQKVRQIDATDPEAARRRRATANRVLTVLKAALNHAFREGKAGSDEAWRRNRGKSPGSKGFAGCSCEGARERLGVTVGAFPWGPFQVL
jgi:hypothetical protein